MHKDTQLWKNTPGCPMDKIPQTRDLRDRISRIISEYVDSQNLAAPLSLDELKTHSQAIIESKGLDKQHRDFIAVLISNHVWSETVAAIPYDHRLLLLPKCLRDHKNCPADVDELGLLCEHCGRCVIDELQTQAEQLGYAVLVAEGSPAVMSLIESGKIEAVIGVSCLSALEKTFPYMEAGAVPGIAIPLLYDGCIDTSLDFDWVISAVYENSSDEANVLNLDELRKTVDSWFTKDNLSKILNITTSETEKTAIDWLAKAGKRWRPFLAAATYMALFANDKSNISLELQKTAVAVECFHKASLIHDDIEDDDKTRYGQDTLHLELGVPIAINIGDILIGEGYRLLAELDIDPSRKAKMLTVASHGHRDLCRGQGSELFWVRSPKPLTVQQVIDIFRKKTSPAFEVALKLGAILAGHEDQLSAVFDQYSQSLGVAYQIKDDIDDFDSLQKNVAERNSKQLSLLFSLANEKVHPEDKGYLWHCWLNDYDKNEKPERLENIFSSLQVKQTAQILADYYKSQAIASLAKLGNTALKSFLRKVICKIFNDIESLGCCDDYKAEHDLRGNEGQNDTR
jgi:geranylgeranyl pyrophosphate synthase